MTHFWATIDTYPWGDLLIVAAVVVTAVLLRRRKG